MDDESDAFMYKSESNVLRSEFLSRKLCPSTMGNKSSKVVQPLTATSTKSYESDESDDEEIAAEDSEELQKMGGKQLIVHSYISNIEKTLSQIVPDIIIDLCYKYYYIVDTFMFAFHDHGYVFVANLNFDDKTKKIWRGTITHQDNQHSVYKHMLSMQSQYYKDHAQNVPIPKQLRRLYNNGHNSNYNHVFFNVVVGSLFQVIQEV